MMGVGLADGDKVVWRYTPSGTHGGDARTPWGTTVPPTGRKVEWKGFAISRIVDGKIAEEWYGDDGVAYYQQIGAIPSPSS
jgi:predicted ester cyclase